MGDSSGDLLWAITQADANTNPAGSAINFDSSVFSTPQTIALTLSETADPEVIDGPGASLATVNGNHAVQVFDVDSGVVATLVGPPISGGLASSNGGGLYNAGGMVSLTDVDVNGNKTEGALGSYLGGAGGCARGGGIYQAIAWTSQL
jgi:hypothetical protein